MSSSSKDDPPETTQTPAQDKFSFLEELTKDQPHTGRPFYQHLFNVYTFLKDHNAPDEVCDAGLFHAIYGTQSYDFHDSRVSREVVRGFIGDYAEGLVYIFCTTKDRFKSIVNNTMGLSNQQAIDLCCIEYANARDQNKSGRKREQLIKLGETIVRLESEREKSLGHLEVEQG